MERSDKNQEIDEAFERIYTELKGLARSSLSRIPNATLTPTALVSEAYVKLAQARSLQLNDRSHFFSLAARAMRQITIDYARANLSQKRGGDIQLVTLDLNQPSAIGTAEELLDLDNALNDLERLSPQQARLVELKVFAGLSVEAIAEILGLATRSAWREWKRARAYLLVNLDRH
jgi:RNA polymerase sigma factor (TIGR02999 family)